MFGTNVRLSFAISNGETELRRRLFVTKMNDLTVTCRCVTDQIQNSCEYCGRTAYYFASFLECIAGKKQASMQWKILFLSRDKSLMLLSSGNSLPKLFKKPWSHFASNAAKQQVSDIKGVL